LRGLLYTLTVSPLLLVSIQVLDGIGVAIFGVVSLLVIADLTDGTGRFNLAQGAIGGAVGIGASLSNAVAGSIAHWYGYSAGFLSLAGIAAGAMALLWVGVTETGPLARRSVPGGVAERPQPDGILPAGGSAATR
jgi:MFS family permease